MLLKTRYFYGKIVFESFLLEINGWNFFVCQMSNYYLTYILVHLKKSCDSVICLLWILMKIGSSVGEWFGRSLAVLGVDGSSLLTAKQRCDGLISLRLTVRFHSFGWILVGQLPQSGQGQIIMSKRCWKICSDIHWMSGRGSHTRNLPSHSI